MNYLCPVCKNELNPCGKSLVCENKHSFDISKEGYVNLILSSKKEHGDDENMVRARAYFLEKGYYSHLADTVKKAVSEFYENGFDYLDAGCGTGYYTKFIAEGNQGECYGIDLSKFAVKYASKKVKNCHFSVGTVYELPYPDESFDVITNIFSPMADGEFARVLEKGGIVVYATPAERHLIEMKSVLYDKPYLKCREEKEYPGFELIRSYDTSRTVMLTGDELFSLFSMTPYFWRTEKGSADVLRSLESLDVSMCFTVYVYRKI